MKIKSLIKVLLSLVLVFGFSSAWAKTIKWSMQGDSLTLDPHAQNEGPTTQVSRQIYEALVERAVNMKIQPALAKSWKAIDPNTWIFTLRKDVKFSDGSKMTSEDVVFSVLRAKQRTSDFKEYISTISGVKAIGDYSVKISTSKPNPILLNTVLVLGSLKVILKGPVPKALVAEKVSCPASQFCGDIAKFFSDHFFDIIKMLDN